MNVRLETIKHLGGKKKKSPLEKGSLTLILLMIFGFDTKNKGNKRKNKQVGLYQSTKLPHIKESHHQQNEKAAS